MNILLEKFSETILTSIARGHTNYYENSISKEGYLVILGPLSCGCTKGGSLNSKETKYFKVLADGSISNQAEVAIPDLSQYEQIRYHSIDDFKNLLDSFKKS